MSDAAQLTSKGSNNRKHVFSSVVIWLCLAALLCISVVLWPVQLVPPMFLSVSSNKCPLWMLMWACHIYRTNQDVKVQNISSFYQDSNICNQNPKTLNSLKNPKFSKERVNSKSTDNFWWYWFAFIYSQKEWTLINITR